MNQSTDYSNVEAFAFGCSLSADNKHADIVVKIHGKRDMELIKSRNTGLSSALRIQRFQCSICLEDFETCSHESGRSYNSEVCRFLASEWRVLHVAVVTSPEDQAASVTDLLLIQRIPTINYTWYSFPHMIQSLRSKHIKKAVELKLIDQEAADHFERDLKDKAEGTSSYMPASH